VLAERQAIESPVAGENPAASKSEHLSLTGFSPAAVPKARRFCLSPLSYLGEVENIWVYLCDLWAICVGGRTLRLCIFAPLR
jgi:hypothetical protein